MMSLQVSSRSWPRFGILLTLCLGLGGINPAGASIIYDFSLPSNGLVGAINIQLTFATFVAAEDGFHLYPLSAAPVTSVSFGTTIDSVKSLVAVEVINGGLTSFGIALF